LDEHEIETAYLLGELGLADALLASMSANAPVPALIADAFLELVNAYRAGQVADLAEPLGLSEGPEARSTLQKLAWRSHVRLIVDDCVAQGFACVDPVGARETAFHRAAEVLGGTAAALHEVYFAQD
jgi:thiazole synthase ThiGH ThiG subunit